jgi:hypothetical protein
MLVGSILLALAVLVAVACAVCWLAGVQLAALAKVLLTVLAVGFIAAGTIIVTGQLLTSAGYYDAGRDNSNKSAETSQTQPEKSPPDSIRETERDGLERLHTDAVANFVGLPGQGIGRFQAPFRLVDLDGVLARPNSGSEDEARGGVVFGVEGGHLRVVSPGWRGQFRADDKLIRGGLFPLLDEGECWTVEAVHLIGLVKHPEPVVYLTDKMPDMTGNNDVPSRVPDVFEKAALEELRAGERLRIEKRGGRLRMVGPIYAGKQCIECHQQEGELLGAFTYQLKRVPIEPSE